MGTYTYDEVIAASQIWFGGDDLAANVWVTKYALQNEKGEFLEKTPSQMFERLAREFARVESKYPNPMSYEEIYSLLCNFDPATGKERFGGVVPQGSPMSGIGNPYTLQSISNCFVISPTLDSFGSILKTDEQQCQIMKRRGGVGHDISNIRPRGMSTANAARTTDGISAFMERFSNSCRTTAQGGRRGALMLTISGKHPEIETFIDIKKDKTKVTGANISIKLHDEFMRAVDSNSDYTLSWPVDVPAEKAKLVKVIKAKELWDKIIHAAWASAEPGILFWDNVLNFGPADIYPEFRSSSTNPCGEIPLSIADSCRLLLMNSMAYITNPYTSNAKLDVEKFELHVRKAQRLMDDLVDLELECVDKIISKIENDPEPEDVKRNELELWKGIRNAGFRGRRTGLGVTGLGDAMASVGLRYGSLESLEWAEELYRLLAVNAYRSTVEMAKERGTFPVYDANLEKGHVFLERILSQDEQLRRDYVKYGRRNISLTTTAPAGSVSILTQTSSGCEPVFRLTYTRRKKINPNDNLARVDFIDALGDKWQHYEVYHHGLQNWINVTGNKDISQSPYANATSENIDWINRVDLQARLQKWICHSISSTINLPKDTTVETVKQIYMRAWKSGTKGITIYREGCRDGVLVSTDVKDPSPNEGRPDEIVESHAPKRPKVLPCDIHHATIRGEKYIVIVGLLNGRPYEVFAGLSENVALSKKIKSGKLVKNGKNNEGNSTYNLSINVDSQDDDLIVFHDIISIFDNPTHGSLTRMISLSLRHGCPVEHLVEQLKKDKHADITSFSSVIARVLGKNYSSDAPVKSGEKCGGCGSTNLARQQGCVTCLDCGWSKC